MKTETQEFQFSESVPDELVDRALNNYALQTESVEDAFSVRQRQYVQQHGECVITVAEDDESLVVTLDIEGGAHKVDVPKYIRSTSAQFSKKDWYEAEMLELVAVSFCLGFPWTPECLLARYTGQVVSGDSEYLLDKEPIFTVYHPPRPEEVSDAASEERDEFLSYPHVTSLDTLTRHYSPPNPWTYAQTAVLYENTPLAAEFLAKSSVWGEDGYEVDVTYPERLEKGD